MFPPALGFLTILTSSSPVAYQVKNPPAIQGTQETWVRLLGQEDPLKMATCSSILAWKTPWTEELDGLSPKGCKESDTNKHPGMA